MLQSTKKGLRGLVVDCLVLALVGLVAMAMVGCGSSDVPPLVQENSTMGKTGWVVEMDTQSPFQTLLCSRSEPAHSRFGKWERLPRSVRDRVERCRPVVLDRNFQQNRRSVQLQPLSSGDQNCWRLHSIDSTERRTMKKFIEALLRAFSTPCW